jgi:hypothetical protein
VRNLKRFLQVALVQRPGKVRQLQPPIANRPWTAEARRNNLILLLVTSGKELVHYVV